MEPSTPSPTQAARRSATFPARFQGGTANRAEESENTSETETLYVHPAAKIVSFNAPEALLPGSRPPAAGTLPWASRYERVLSAGPLRCYRLPNQVCYLHAGTILLTLLPRSQCWCVDGISKFAMRIKSLIYRIELPASNDDEMAKVEELKQVLGKVIQYEKTACPFIRGFYDDLPDEDDSPLRMRLIGPRGTPRSADTSSKSRHNERLGELGRAANGHDELHEGDSFVAEEDDGPGSPSNFSPVGSPQEDTKPPIRPRSPNGDRVVSAPAIIAAQPKRSRNTLESLHSTDDTGELSQRQYAEANSAKSAAIGSETFEAPASAPPDEEDLASETLHTDESRRLLAEHDSPIAATQNIDESLASEENELQARSLQVEEEQTQEPTLEEPPEEEPQTSVAEPQGSLQVQDQALQQDEPTLAPLERPSTPVDAPLETPAASSNKSPGNISPASPSRPAIRAPLTRSIISGPFARNRHGGLSPTEDLNLGLFSRACAVLLRPPSDLIAIMMQIASRIATGAFGGGGAYRLRLISGNRLPGRWEDSDEDAAVSEIGSGGLGVRRIEDEFDDDDDLDDWMEEDDYGVPLANDTASRAKRAGLGSSRDVD